METTKSKQCTLEEIHAKIFGVESDYCDSDDSSDGGSEAGSVDSDMEDAFAEGVDHILDV